MKIKIGEVTGFSLKKWDNFDWPAVSELDGSLSYAFYQAPTSATKLL